MKLITISQISKEFQISTRALRYYEEIGLLESQTKDGYAYRVYDEKSVRKLQKILLLKKLRIPLKQIDEMLGNNDIALAVEIFINNIEEIEKDISSLSSIKSALELLLTKIYESANTQSKLDLLDDKFLLEEITSIIPNNKNIKETKTMSEINKANENLSKLKDEDVRIIYLPPSPVASINFRDIENPENKCGDAMDKFVLETGLRELKPDMRLYGFNSPPPTEKNPQHGYEFYVTIPDDMVIEPPFVKKQFEGGLFAAYSIVIPNFAMWGELCKWVLNSNKYEIVETWPDSYEEHLNYYNYVTIPNEQRKYIQLDLLIPVREKE